MTTAIDTPEVEGSFAARWEKFVEDNNLTPDVAEKLQGVFYAGGASVFDELQMATPLANTPADIHKASVAFTALNEEVYGFFNEGEDDDLSVLVIKGTEDGAAT